MTESENTAKDVRPGLELSVKRAEELLKGVMIPPQPTILVNVLNERSKPDPDLERIGDIISADVALAASMLKVVNSPFFGLRRKIGSIHHAVRLLGIGNVVNIASGLMLKAAFADQRGPFMDTFWKHSARHGVVATMIARETRVSTAEDSYAAGLFADCGVPVLRRRFANYSELYAQAQIVDEFTWTEYEEEELGTNHAVVGYMMAHGWMLPDVLAQGILQHHDPVDQFHGAGFDAEPAVQLQAVLHTTLHVCRAIDGLPVSKEWEAFGDRILAFLGVDDTFVTRMVEEVQALPPEAMSHL
ncbi:MAG: HDOD domain-containing protein [Rhodothermales bacterium]|nr:HDOD domain-containing protein [Rhodothermales bacterium]MBO6779749.1 HDOD domain-containing protein [Rhodothermales bacterium]